MNCIRALFLGFVGAVGFATSASADSLIISGFVGTVGSNLGTSIDGSSPNFADRDAYTITLTYNPVQPPYTTAQGGGNTAIYYLLHTNITIFADDGALTWTLSTPAANDASHGFGIANNVSGYDTFSAGQAGFTYSGPTLGPGSKAFSHWSLNYVDYEGTIFSSISIPDFASLNLNDFNFPGATLVFAGFMTGDAIELSRATSITVSAVPESSSFALLAGLTGAAAIVLARRRRV